MYEYGTLTLIEAILMGKEKRKNGAKSEYNVCIYGNVTVKCPVQLLCTNKNAFKK
jgi:hypothetical protein